MRVEPGKLNLWCRFPLIGPVEKLGFAPGLTAVPPGVLGYRWAAKANTHFTIRQSRKLSSFDLRNDRSFSAFFDFLLAAKDLLRGLNRRLQAPPANNGFSANGNNALKAVSQSSDSPYIEAALVHEFDQNQKKPAIRNSCPVIGVSA